MTTHPILTLASRYAASGSLIALCLVTASCKLPSREAWSQVQQRGLFPVLLADSGTSAASSTATTPEGSSKGVAKADPGPSPAVQSPAVRVQAVTQPEIASIPFATPVPGRAGYVYSPHTQNKKLIDVRSYAAGAEARCPYTMQAFQVPDFQALASQKSTPRLKPEKSIAEVATRGQSDRLPARREESSRSNRAASDQPSREDEPHVNINPPPSLPKLPDTPYGSRVPGRVGFVYSPFAEKNQLVDVAGIAPGVEVKCPYSNKLFRVPEPLAEEINPAPAKVIPPAPPAPRSAPEPTASSSPPPAPAASPAPAPEKAPTASWADKDKKQVQSPFGTPGQLIDVSGRAAGSTMACPFTNKEFVVPAE